MTEEEQTALLEIAAELQAKLDFANAKLRQENGQPRVPSVIAAPADYTGPRGNSGQRIMTQEEAWAMAKENARIMAESKRKRLGS